MTIINTKHRKKQTVRNKFLASEKSFLLIDYIKKDEFCFEYIRKNLGVKPNRKNVPQLFTSDSTTAPNS